MSNNTPAIRLIPRRCSVKYAIIAVLLAVDRRENRRRGNPIPKPNDRKLRMFSRKSRVVNVLVNRTAIKAGLQGTTMAPKKKPKEKALIQGFFCPVDILAFGRYLPKSTLNIISRLIINSMPKAIGDITPITFVKETCRTVVNIIPSKNMNKITPAVMTTPKSAIVLLLDSSAES
jgi:hypothetical protein